MRSHSTALFVSAYLLIASACTLGPKPTANSDDLSYCDGGNPIIEFFPPAYPEECISKGVEGRVTAEYDVTRNGSVENVTITESPDSCFHDAMIDRVQSRHYPPMCNTEGVPVARSGVSVTITYELSSD